MKQGMSDDFSLGVKLFTAGTAACIADLATFPLDTAKVRMQVSKVIIIINLNYISQNNHCIFRRSKNRIISFTKSDFSRSRGKAKPCCWHRRKDQFLQ